MKKPHEIEIQWWPRIFEAAVVADLMTARQDNGEHFMPHIDRLIEVSYYLGGNERTDLTLLNSHLWELVEAYMKERR